MRLFIAVNFTDDIKDRLCGIISDLKDKSIRGNFTYRDNLHLTLIFIGETARVNEVKHAMDEMKGEQFLLNISGFGRFKRDGGDIYWVGVEKSNSLLSIYGQMAGILKKSGFELEKREYSPHLTLGREVLLQDGFNIGIFEKSIPRLSMGVNKISLMKSERIKGKLTYTEIYSKALTL